MNTTNTAADGRPTAQHRRPIGSARHEHRRRVGLRMQRASGQRSVEDLAHALKVHPKTLARYFSGERDPGTEFVDSFCRLTGSSADYIVRGRKAG